MNGTDQVHGIHSNTVTDMEVLNLDRAMGRMHMLLHAEGGFGFCFRELLTKLSSLALHGLHIGGICLHLTEGTDGLICFVLGLLQNAGCFLGGVLNHASLLVLELGFSFVQRGFAAGKGLFETFRIVSGLL